MSSILELEVYWFYTHTPINSYNSKANGKVDSAVKLMKNLFQKAKVTQADPYLAMLDHQNTHTKSFLSQALKLLSRRTKTLLISNYLLKPEILINKNGH